MPCAPKHYSPSGQGKLDLYQKDSLAYSHRMQHFMHMAHVIGHMDELFAVPSVTPSTPHSHSPTARQRLRRPTWRPEFYAACQTAGMPALGGVYCWQFPNALENPKT